MKLLTGRFIKDILFSIVFFILYYGLTHNTIAYPVPEIYKGVWSIEKLQYPLAFRLAGHNYLALRDNKGKILYELHGLATNKETNTWTYVGMGNGELLQVWKFDTAIFGTTKSILPGIVLRTGDEKLIRSLWEKAVNCSDRINKKNIPYPHLGISLYETENSNAVAYTLTRCMGLEDKRIGIIIPGEKTDLLK